MTVHKNVDPEILTCDERDERDVVRTLKTLRGIIMHELPTNISNDIYSSEFINYVEAGQYTTYNEDD